MKYWMTIDKEHFERVLAAGEMHQYGFVFVEIGGKVNIYRHFQEKS